MKFIIFVIAKPGALGTSSEMAEIDKFNEKMQSSGHWVTAAGIASADNSLLIDNRNNKNEIISGSLVVSEENYSGFWIIEADSFEIARNLALEGSKACNRKVELRPYLVR